MEMWEGEGEVGELEALGTAGGRGVYLHLLSLRRKLVWRWWFLFCQERFRSLPFLKLDQFRKCAFDEF
jgi:hypothetical protein